LRDGTRMRLQADAIESDGRNSEFSEFWAELQGLCDFDVNVDGPELRRWPTPLALALNSCVPATSGPSINVDAVLTLPLPPVAHRVPIAPFRHE
jgi:hypothetical protein